MLIGVLLTALAAGQHPAASDHDPTSAVGTLRSLRGSFFCIITVMCPPFQIGADATLISMSVDATGELPSTFGYQTAGAWHYTLGDEPEAEVSTPAQVVADCVAMSTISGYHRLYASGVDGGYRHHVNVDFPPEYLDVVRVRIERTEPESPCHPGGPIADESYLWAGVLQ